MVCELTGAAFMQVYLPIAEMAVSPWLMATLGLVVGCLSGILILVWCAPGQEESRNGHRPFWGKFCVC